MNLFDQYADPEIVRVMRQLSRPIYGARNQTKLHEQLIMRFMPSLQSETISPKVVSACTTVWGLAIAAKLHRMEQRLMWYLIVATSIVLAAIHFHW